MQSNSDTTEADTASRPVRDIVGLIPAAGEAARIAPLPVSKELFPLGFGPAQGGDGRRPKVVSHYLLEKMRRAGASKAYIVLRDGKWDIPSYFGDGARLDLHLGYLMMGPPFGVPYTLDQAYPFVMDALVAFGFADIVFQPDDAFAQLLSRQNATQADAVLGLFRANLPQACDMVDLGDDGRIREIAIKPERTDLVYTWNIAVWTPAFTAFMHDYVARKRSHHEQNHGKAGAPGYREMIVGDVIHAAIRDRLHVEGVPFGDGRYLDIGTPDDLVKAVRELNCGDE